MLWFGSCQKLVLWWNRLSFLFRQIALRSCVLFNSAEISFENIHSICKKCTSKQIMMYQIALKLHKLLNEVYENCSLEHVTVLNELVCTSRQTTFEVLRNNKYKIGMNTTSNKLYHISKQIGLHAIGLSFVHFKKLMKIQFLKYGKTWPAEHWAVSCVN